MTVPAGVVLFGSASVAVSTVGGEVDVLEGGADGPPVCDTCAGGGGGQLVWDGGSGATNGAADSMLRDSSCSHRPNRKALFRRCFNMTFAS